MTSVTGAQGGPAPGRSLAFGRMTFPKDIPQSHSLLQMLIRAKALFFNSLLRACSAGQEILAERERPAALWKPNRGGIRPQLAEAV